MFGYATEFTFQIPIHYSHLTKFVMRQVPFSLAARGALTGVTVIDSLMICHSVVF